MSADNTIFVVEYPTKSGIRYRVFHVIAAGNMRMFSNVSQYFTWVLQQSPIVEDPTPYVEKETAMQAARFLQKQVGAVEYGVQFVKAPEEIPVATLERLPWESAPRDASAHAG